jgi:hypothetical protein
MNKNLQVAFQKLYTGNYFAWPDGELASSACIIM